MSEHGQYALDDSYRPWSVPASNTSLTWILLTTVFGAYALFKAVELAGFPVSLCIAQFVDMSLGALRLPRASLESREAGSDSDTIQRAGGLLSSIFGSYSESLLQKGVTRFTSALSSGPSNIPPGLGNISNSCYQNSVIQGLAALPSLRDYLSTITAEHPSFTADSTSGVLHDLINSLNDPANLGKNFWIRGKLKSMSTFTQQDAQEYFSKILDDMDREVKKASSSKRRSSVSWFEATKSLSTSPSLEDDAVTDEAGKAARDQPRLQQSSMLSNPLDGLIAQRVGCTLCGYSEGLSLINFNCITVSLGNNNTYDIRDCLDEYTKLEYIDGVECAKCTLLKLQKTLTPLATAGSPFEAKLNTVSDMINDEKFEDNTLVKTLNIPKKNWVQSSKSKQIVVARAPKSLVIHVNRSNFDEMTGASYKNTAGVSYPRILDLGNWCLGSYPSCSRQPDMSLEEWPRDPTQSMLAQADEPMTISPFQYRLRAAVTHFGSHGNGHYVCYRPHARIAPQSESSHELGDQSSSEEQWWRFSDDTVYAVPEEQAHQANVFMLFYERVDMPTTSKAVEEEFAPVLLRVTEDAPLPPDLDDISQATVHDTDVAITVSLPDDDDALDFIPPELRVIGQTTDSSPYADGITLVPDESSPVPSFQGSREQSVEGAAYDTETEMSGAESEDAPSTQVTSDSETERFPPPAPKPYMRVPPHTMRTAGNAAVRGQGSRRSLPMVSAT
jgi:ubiquitin carboxyl-terminal hydrolase 1